VRALASVFGTVRVTRCAYRAKGAGSLHPVDAVLNLPAEKHSHGLRALAAVEATRGSYTEAAAAVQRATGVTVGMRQLQALAGLTAVDFDALYAQRCRRPPSQARCWSSPPTARAWSCARTHCARPPLRPATAKAAQGARTKLATGLPKGEKRNRKRMTELAAVYDQTPLPRSSADIMPTDASTAARPAPAAKNTWLTASVVDDAAAVIAAAFTEAERRDPAHVRTWVALVDGNNHQIERIHAEAKARCRHPHHSRRLRPRARVPLGRGLVLPLRR